jgi:7-keto-8-aminopelargonate synthetase-like enzyme
VIVHGVDAAQLGLADFYAGDPLDPLEVPAEFMDWRHATARQQSLLARRLTMSVGPRTALRYQERICGVVNFASLDYLGFARLREIADAQICALPEWGSGAAGVPLLTGMSEQHGGLEHELASLTGKSSAMLYSSGFAAAIGTCCALLRRGDVAICDDRTHMSWFDGIRMAGARLATFRHNDVASLAEVLERHEGARRVVIVDALYSMDGDFAPLERIVAVAKEHAVKIIVDEAHSVFADGPGGGGTISRLGLNGDVAVYMGTLSKALAMVGGFVAAAAPLVDYMRYYSHPYVFSGALPPALVAGTRRAVAIARTAEDRRRRLQENARYMRTQLAGLGLNIGNSESWIIPVIFGSRRDLLFEAAERLMRAGVYVVPVDFPAVPEDQVRLRVTVSAEHTRDDLDEGLNRIGDIVVPLLQ